MKPDRNGLAAQDQRPGSTGRVAESAALRRVHGKAVGGARSANRDQQGALRGDVAQGAADADRGRPEPPGDGACSIAVDKIIPADADQHDLARVAVVDREQGSEACRVRPGAGAHDEHVRQREMLAHLSRRGDPPFGKREVVERDVLDTTAVPREVAESRGPSGVVGVFRKRRREQRARGDQHRRRGARGGDRESVRESWAGPPPDASRAHEPDAERRPQRVGQHVGQARVAPGNGELRDLDRERERRAQCEGAERPPAVGAQGQAQREEQRDVQQNVGHRPVAAQHAKERGNLLHPSDGDQRRSGNHAEPENQEQAPRPHTVG